MSSSSLRFLLSQWAYYTLSICFIPVPKFSTTTTMAAAFIPRRLLHRLSLSISADSHLLFMFSHPLSTFSPPITNPNPNQHQRSLTPLETQFQSWTTQLRPGFTPSDLVQTLDSLSDPDLALDLFRWSSLSPHFRHTPSTYLSLLRLLLRYRRFSSAESLLHDVLSGVTPPNLPLYNLLLRFSSSRRHLFTTSFDLYKKLVAPSSPIKPDLETYTTLMSMLLRRFGRPPVAFIHLHALRSLVRQMRAYGIVPDAFVMNLIIKGYSRCLEMDEAVRVFREMGAIYHCERSEYSYGYVAKGLVEKGRVEEGMSYFREMRDKGLVPTSSVYMAVVCGLAMGGRFEEGKQVVEDMIGNGRKPDILTYRTLLEGLCREGRAEEAFEWLEELGRTKGAMQRKVYDDLLEGLHWINQPHH